MTRQSTLSRIAAAFLLVSLLVGCNSNYAIQGRVIRGSVASIQLVDKNDRRLTEDNPTGGGGTVEGIFEPDTPSELQSLPQVVTDGQGRFAIPVDAVGAGFLEYEATLIARRQGHQGVMQTIDLPRRGQRVLIILPLGRDTLKVPKSFLDQTLDDARPFLEENR